MNTDISTVLKVVETAKSVFALQLKELAARGGLSREMYVRYLTFQYHLTKGVQRHFLKVAGHPRLSGKAALRQFLFKFGLEEEAHYKVAEIDLDRIRGVSPRYFTSYGFLWGACLSGQVLRRNIF